VEGCEIPPGFYIPSTTTVHSITDLESITKISPRETEFSESVAKANNELVTGYRRIQNQF
jgi:hypothetical protein